MTPAELYASTPISAEPGLPLESFGYRMAQFPEVPEGAAFLPTEDCRLVVKTHAYYQMDHRRFWELASWWLDEKPFMVTQNAGREGDDWARRWITDLGTYQEAIYYILSRINHEFKAMDDEVPVDADIGNLRSFYDRTLELGQQTYSCSP